MSATSLPKSFISLESLEMTGLALSTIANTLPTSKLVIIKGPVGDWMFAGDSAARLHGSRDRAPFGALRVCYFPLAPMKSPGFTTVDSSLSGYEFR